jgi:hypothetical protein
MVSFRIEMKKAIRPMRMGWHGDDARALGAKSAFSRKTGIHFR